MNGDKNLTDKLAEYLARDERFDNATEWLPPRRVDIPAAALTQYHKMLVEDPDDSRDITYTDFMVFAWPAQLSRSNDASKIGNIVERLVVEARLRLVASPARPLDDLTEQLHELSGGESEPWATFLNDCWDATKALLTPSEHSRSTSFALGRFLSAHAVSPGWGVALDIALCADRNRFLGEVDGDLDINEAIWRAAFEEVGIHDDAPSSVYLQTMLVQLDQGGPPADIAVLAERSIQKPEHPWVSLFLGYQLLSATYREDLDDAGGMVHQGSGDDVVTDSLLAPIYSLPGEEVSFEIERERSFGRSLQMVASLGSGGQPSTLVPEVGLHCAYVAFGRVYLANGTQPGGSDGVLAVNAAAALIRIGVLTKQQELIQCASEALLERLADADVAPGSIPELALVTQVALGSEFSRSRRRQGMPVPTAVAEPHRARRGDELLALAERLRADAGEDPQRWETGYHQQLVRAQLAEHEWWEYASRRARLDIEDAMLDRELGRRPVIWGRSLGIALEEMSRTWVEPLREAAKKARQKELRLGYGAPDDVHDLRASFTLGTMAKLFTRWTEGKVDDQIVAAFLENRRNRVRKSHLPLLMKAAELRNRANHADSFDDANAMDLKDVAFQLFPLLVASLSR